MATITLKGGYAATDPRLDRLPYLDPRSRAFPIRALLPDTVALRSRTWPVRWGLDQSREGACTSFALAHNRVGRPRPKKIAATPAEAEALARRLYRRSQQIDEWPGESYEGTSALAACKAWQEAGLLAEYRWAFGIDDLIATLSTHGPVCAATEWLDGMFAPDSRGLLEVDGSIAGGHMYALHGVALRPHRSRLWKATGEREPLVLGWQSWGDDWGPLGALFAVRAADMERLLKGIRWPGECVVPLDRAA